MLHIKQKYRLETLNIRKGAGTNYDVTAIAEQGDKLEVVEEAEDGWIQVKLSDEEKNGLMFQKSMSMWIMIFRQRYPQKRNRKNTMRTGM